MPRARISKNGIELAKHGYDVNTASLANLILSPQFSTMRIALMGATTVAPYTGAGSDAHDRSVITFATPFPSAPLVLAAGVIDENTSDQSPLVYQYQADSGATWTDTHYCIITTASNFTLYVMKSGIGNRAIIPRTWKYFVFANSVG